MFVLFHDFYLLLIFVLFHTYNYLLISITYYLLLKPGRHSCHDIGSHFRHNLNSELASDSITHCFRFSLSLEISLERKGISLDWTKSFHVHCLLSMFIRVLGVACMLCVIDPSSVSRRVIRFWKGLLHMQMPG